MHRTSSSSRGIRLQVIIYVGEKLELIFQAHEWGQLIFQLNGGRSGDSNREILVDRFQDMVFLGISFHFESHSNSSDSIYVLFYKSFAFWPMFRF